MLMVTLNSQLFLLLFDKEDDDDDDEGGTEVATQRVNDGRAHMSFFFMCYKLITIFFSMTHSTRARNVMEFSRLFLQSSFFFLSM